jgi:hypothetical protein
MARFFELRQGYALHKAGIALDYEIPAEGTSTIDFGFASDGRPWNIELMRLEETDAAISATRNRVDENGTQWTGRLLWSHAEDQRQTLEGETLKAIERICQKCEQDGKPYKFLPPTNQINALIIDFRTFNSGHSDMHDLDHVIYGGHTVPWQYRLYWGKAPRLISGVYSPETRLKGAALLRERVHFIGIARERTFAPDELPRVTKFFANPHLFPDQAAAEAAFATWPLKPE